MHSLSINVRYTTSKLILLHFEGEYYLIWFLQGHYLLSGLGSNRSLCKTWYFWIIQLAKMYFTIKHHFGCGYCQQLEQNTWNIFVSDLQISVCSLEFKGVTFLWLTLAKKHVIYLFLNNVTGKSFSRLIKY